MNGDLPRMLKAGKEVYMPSSGIEQVLKRPTGIDAMGHNVDGRTTVHETTLVVDCV
jgi:hypothetical protein